MKLGFSVFPNTVKNVLRRYRIPPAPERNKHGLSWQTFLGQFKDQMLACDFFTVETAWLKTIYALFFIELGTRRIHFAGCTANPSGNWVTQQARQILWKLEELERRIRFLIHDRDKKFSQSFDIVFRSEGIRLLRTPYQAPNANAFAERWVRSVREECLNKMLIWNEAHLRRILVEYVDYFNTRRPHQGLGQETPEGLKSVSTAGPVHC